MAEVGGFQALQRSFADHLRDPTGHPPPPGVEERRLTIYRELFFNSIEGLLAGNFPVLKRLLAPDDAWRALVRSFYAGHRSQTPYFTRIAREFIDWLAGPGAVLAPAYAPELAHYEWVELALAIEEIELPLDAVDATGDLLALRPAVSPLAWSLSYTWPVHRLAPGKVPASLPEAPTLLVVYRDRADRIGFLEINAVTARLLELLQTADCTGSAALARLAEELDLQPTALSAAGIQILEQLRGHGILLGTWHDDGAAT
jgi:uncharacterized protein